MDLTDGALSPGPIVVGATRPYPRETANGDAWHVDRLEHTTRIALIDGLGHGPDAALAAQRAVVCLRNYPDLSPSDALRVCHAALSGSRGAALSIALVDSYTRRLTYAGVGNVEALLWVAGRQSRPIAYRGIIGATLPTLRSSEHDLGDAWILLLHTDGISSRLDPPSLPEFGMRAHQQLADAALARWGRTSDDATVVVAAPS